MKDKRQSGSKGNKVSYKLMDKNNIEMILDRVVTTGKYPDRKNSKDISRILNLDQKQVLKSCLARVKYFIEKDSDDKQSTRISNLLALILILDLDERYIEQQLVPITKLPGIKKELKLLLLSFLVDLGSDEETVAALIGADELIEMTEYAIESMIGFAKGDLAQRLFFLQEFDKVDSNEQRELLEELVADDTDSATEMLGVLAYSYDTVIALTAVRCLGKTLRARAYDILNELKVLKDADLVSAVEEELKYFKRFRSSRQPKGPWKSPLGRLHDAVVTSIDGLGSRMVWLTWEVPNRKTKLVGVGFLLNTIMGIKDCFGMPNLTKGELEKMVNEISERGTILRGDYDYCLALIRDALDLSLKKGGAVPGELAFWRRCLPTEVYPKVYTPRLKGCLPKSQKQAQESFERSDGLFDYKEFFSWYEEMPEVYDIAEKVLETIKKPSDKMNNIEIKVRQLENKLIKEVIYPLLPELRRRLLFTADYLKKSGKNQLARDTMVCLVSLESVVPEKHPFIRRMSFESIKTAVENLKQGYDLRLDDEIPH